VAWNKGNKSAYDKANEAAAKREDEIRGLLDDIIGSYAPGGSYMKGQEAMLGREKQKYLGSATQNLISSGLYGSTMMAGAPKKWEEEIGIPTRAKLEDIRTQAYTSALAGKADFINSITETVPDYGMMAQLTAEASSAPQQSLNDWLYGTFQGQGFGSSKINNSDAALEDKNAAARAYTQSYTAPKISFSEPMMGNTEAAREARKKSGYYLDSSGTLKKL
jgi:hypothetical protein